MSETQTREQIEKERAEVLASCKEKSKLAVRLIANHAAWIKEAEAAFPAPYSWDKRTKKKNATFASLYERVYHGQWLHTHNVERFADEDRRAAEKARQDAYDAKRKEITDRAEAEHKRLKTAAVIWLQAKGKVLGTHFDLENALEFANQLAADEWLANVKPDTYSFAGEDNCEGCSGWDGVSHRCNCGNRRVYWERNDSHTFENPSFSAVAY